MEKEIISLNEEEMKLLLEALDYKISEDGVVLDKNEKEVKCPFSGEAVDIKKISIMPGSLVLMNTSPLTLSEYFYQYPDD